MSQSTKETLSLLVTSALIVAGSTVTAPAAHADFFNTHETELLGIHTFNPVTRPADEPAAIAQSAEPLYPDRYDANAKTNPNHISPLAIKADSPKTSPSKTVAVEPTKLAKLEMPEPTSIKLAQHSDDDRNTRLPLAPSNASPLAVSGATDAALADYQRQRGITAPSNTQQPVTRLSTAPVTQPLQPLPATLPPTTPFKRANSTPAPTPNPAPAPNKDIIEPGISYAPEPSNAPISLGQPLHASNTSFGQPPALSDDVRQVLAGYPDNIASAKPGKSKKIDINRVSPDIAKIVDPNTVEASYESAGIKIEVSRPGLDTNYELSRAYDALTAGNTSEAIRTYRDILSVEPNNEEALFGLAATLHRIGAVEKAQPLYASLLKRNPNHREALNNYLSVVGNDAPEDAIIELGHLKARNPNFSPIPAQMGLLYAKLGQYEQARAQMIEAIALSPEDLAYQYNLAVILDKQRNYADAAALYGSLLRAQRNGASLPVEADEIQSRYSYLSTKKAQQYRQATAR